MTASPTLRVRPPVLSLHAADYAAAVLLTADGRALVLADGHRTTTLDPGVSKRLRRAVTRATAPEQPTIGGPE